MLNPTQNNDLLLFNTFLCEEEADEEADDSGEIPENTNLTDNHTDVNAQIIPKEKKYCLITDEILDKNSIKLDCGHAFNYIPLYNEVCQQKIKRLLDNANLLLNEVKCPYCRGVTKQLLPYYKYFNVKSIRGINAPVKYCMEINQCQYLHKNKNQCNVSACYTKYGYLCNKHVKYNIDSEALLETFDKSIYELYSKKKIVELKSILKLNYSKLGGNKQELVERIVLNKNNNVSWIE